MRLPVHALAGAPPFQPLAAVAVASSDWWEVEAQAFMCEGRDWDAVCSAMRAAVASEDTPLPGDALQPPLPNPLPPWTPPPERAPPKDKTRRETWALCLAYYGPAYTSFTWQPEQPHETVIGMADAGEETPMERARAALAASAAQAAAAASAFGSALAALAEAGAHATADAAKLGYEVHAMRMPCAHAASPGPNPHPHSTL